MIGLGLGLSRLSSILGGIIKKGLQMWLGFNKADILGVELVVNGDFAVYSDWTTEVSWEISRGYAHYDALNHNKDLLQSLITEAGKSYKLSYQVSNVEYSTRARFKIVANGNSTPTIVSYKEHINGVYEVDYNCTISGNIIQFTALSTGTNDGYFDLSNVSLKEIAQLIPDKSTNTNEAKLFTGKALSFDGVNDKVQFTPQVLSGEFAIATWFNTASDSSDNSLFGDGSHQDCMRVRQNANILELRISTGGGGGIYEFVSPFELNTWYRLVFTRDSSNNIRCFMNGIESSTGALVESLPIKIRYIGMGYSSWQYLGLATDFQIYNSYWTSSDIAYDYNNPNNLVIDNVGNTTITKANLVGYWALSEGSGNVVFDSAGLGGELVTNGNFATDSDWTTDTSTSIDTVNHLLVQDGTAGRVYQAVSFLEGNNTNVIVTFTVERLDSGSFQLDCYGLLSQVVNTSDGVGKYSFQGSTTNNTNLYINNGGGYADGSISNISVREVTDNDGTAYDGNADNHDGDGTVLGATWIHRQPTIPQLGMMDWSKGSNLIKFSEPTVDEGSAAGVTYESFTWANTAGANFTNCVRFDSTTLNYRYGGTSLPSVEQTGSAYVIMDDLSEPIISEVSDSGDMCIVVDGGITGGTINKVDVGRNVWRVSRTFTNPDSGTSLNNGIVQYAEQSGKSFRVVGWQLEEGTLGSYIGTSGFPALNATLIQNPNDIGKDVLGNSLRLREGGFNLDGSGYAEIAKHTSIDFGTGVFSLECWVQYKHYINPNAQTSALNVIVSNGKAKATDTEGFNLISRSSNRLEVRLGDGDAEYARTITETFVENTWYHIAFTRKATLLTIYVNGGTGAEYTDPDIAADVSRSNPVYVGRDLEVNRFYSGLIDEVRLYDRILDQKEVTNNYKAGLSKHS